jgi:hypothetical protein
LLPLIEKRRLRDQQWQPERRQRQMTYAPSMTSLLLTKKTQQQQR